MQGDERGRGVGGKDVGRGKEGEKGGVMRVQYTLLEDECECRSALLFTSLH